MFEEEEYDQYENDYDEPDDSYWTVDDDNNVINEAY